MKKSIMLLIAMVLSCTSLISQEKSVPVLDSGITTQAVIPAEPLSNDATMVQLLDKYAGQLTYAINCVGQPAKEIYAQLVKKQIITAIIEMTICYLLLILFALGMYKNRESIKHDFSFSGLLLTIFAILFVVFVILCACCTSLWVGTICAPDWFALKEILTSIQ